MHITLYLVLIVLFGVIAYQDIKMRLIHFALPMLILVLGMALNWDIISFNELGKSLLFLMLNFVVLALYFFIKNRQWINPFQSMMGIGDVLFLLGVIPLFSFKNYILFFIIGMLFSLMLFIFFKHKYRVDETIPLAGYLSIFILGMIGSSLIMNSHLLLKSL